MAILSKSCKPDNFKLHNSLKLSFTNVWDLHSDFVDCESFLESSTPDVLALCETNLNGSIDSGNFSVRGYLPLIRKVSSTHTHGLTVYLKASFCMWLICRFLLMFSTCFTLLSVLRLFPLLISFFVIMHGLCRLSNKLKTGYPVSSCGL